MVYPISNHDYDSGKASPPSLKSPEQKVKLIPICSLFAETERLCPGLGVRIGRSSSSKAQHSQGEKLKL